MFASLLGGTVEAEGGGAGRVADGFNGAVLWYDVDEVDHVIRFADSEDDRGNGRAEDCIFKSGKHD